MTLMTASPAVMCQPVFHRQARLHGVAAVDGAATVAVVEAAIAAVVEVAVAVEIGAEAVRAQVAAAGATRAAVFSADRFVN